MKRFIPAVSCVLALMAAPSAAQTGSGGTPNTMAIAEANKKQTAEAEAQLQKMAAAQNSRFVRTLTNVQIEVTLTDQTGAGAPDKKVVSMIASSGSWGKVRSTGSVFPIGEPPYAVQLNVDARPFVSVEGPIQLEITVEYVPIRGEGDPKVGPKQRPSGINQSQTVVMQSGKSLVVSQAADPISDRKVIVEVKATVLK
jgi:hypothetical protein